MPTKILFEAIGSDTAVKGTKDYEATEGGINFDWRVSIR